MVTDVRWQWIAWMALSALIFALLAFGLATAIDNWHLTDLKAYVAAADLLADGGNPYDVELWERGLPYHYHYAPWFAGLFIPLSGLPTDLLRITWSATLIVASAAALAPVLRRFGWISLPLAGLMVFLLANLVAEGNVQPLLLAGLVWSLERRAGPVMIGVAASLKIVPIVLALVYVGRGEWSRAAVAVATAAVLTAPTLLFEIAPQAVDTGGTGLFTSMPVVWATSALAAAAAAIYLARTRYGWLAASTATVLALPRLLIFDVTNLLTALPDAGYSRPPSERSIADPRHSDRLRDDRTTGRAELP